MEYSRRVRHGWNYIRQMQTMVKKNKNKCKKNNGKYEMLRCELKGLMYKFAIY